MGDLGFGLGGELLEVEDGVDARVELDGVEGGEVGEGGVEGLEVW